MPADEEVGVVDRVVESIAVVLVGGEAEYQLPATSLPEGAGEGSWLRVRRDTSGLVVLGRDDAGEAEQRDRAQDRLAALRQRRGGRFS